MKNTLFTCFLLVFTAISCRTSKNTILPLSKTIQTDDTYTIIWYGKGEAYRYKNEEWERDSTYDYQFNVIQKRYLENWKSVKSLQRIHPEYDGKAGERNQVMYFELNYKKAINDTLPIIISSSLGEGNGYTDSMYSKASLNISCNNLSQFSPYNALNISQYYNYQKGILTETVMLYKENAGKELPFMKIEERAIFYEKQIKNEN